MDNIVVDLYERINTERQNINNETVKTIGSNDIRITRRRVSNIRRDLESYYKSELLRISEEDINNIESHGQLIERVRVISTEISKLDNILSEELTRKTSRIDEIGLRLKEVDRLRKDTEYNIREKEFDILNFEQRLENNNDSDRMKDAIRNFIDITREEITRKEEDIKDIDAEKENLNKELNVLINGGSLDLENEEELNQSDEIISQEELENIMKPVLEAEDINDNERAIEPEVIVENPNINEAFVEDKADMLDDEVIDVEPIVVNEQSEPTDLTVRNEQGNFVLPDGTVIEDDDEYKKYALAADTNGDWVPEVQVKETSEELEGEKKSIFKKAKPWITKLTAIILVIVSLATSFFAGRKSAQTNLTDSAAQEHTLSEEEEKKLTMANEIIQNAIEEEKAVAELQVKLEALIKKCESVNPDNYTKESYENMLEHLKHAKLILASNDFTSETLEIELKELQEAYDGLVKIKNNSNSVDSDKIEVDKNDQGGNRGSSGGSGGSGGDGGDGGDDDPGKDDPSQEEDQDKELDSENNVYLKTGEGIGNESGEDMDKGPWELRIEKEEGKEIVIGADGSETLVDEDGNVLATEDLEDSADKGNVSIDGEDYLEVSTENLEDIEVKEPEKAPIIGDEVIVTPSEEAKEVTFDELPDTLTQDQLDAILGQGPKL